MIIEKKTWPEYFKAIKRGDKNFELRLADFQVKIGDTLLLKEWNPKSKEYTGREIRKKVGYILKTKNLNFHKAKEREKYGYYILELR